MLAYIWFHPGAFPSDPSSTHPSAFAASTAFCGLHHRRLSLPCLLSSWWTPHPSLSSTGVSSGICYLYFLYHGRNRQRAVNTIYGLYIQQPAVRERLRGSEALLKGWQRMMPSVPHPPDWPLTVAIARTMAAIGYSDCAVAALLLSMCCCGWESCLQ